MPMRCYWRPCAFIYSAFNEFIWGYIWIPPQTFASPLSLNEALWRSVWNLIRLNTGTITSTGPGLSPWLHHDDENNDSSSDEEDSSSSEDSCSFSQNVEQDFFQNTRHLFDNFYRKTTKFRQENCATSEEMSDLKDATFDEVRENLFWPSKIEKLDKHTFFQGSASKNGAVHDQNNIHIAIINQTDQDQRVLFRRYQGSKPPSSKAGRQGQS